MQIAIDARAASNTQTGGFKTYAEGLLEGLAALESPHTFWVYTDRPYQFSARRPANFNFRVVPANLKLIGAGWREQVAMPLDMASRGVDVAHFPYNTAPLWARGKRVVTIHDLILLRDGAAPARASATLHHRLMNQYNRLFLLWAARTANAIITDSDFSAKEIVQRFPRTNGRVHAIPLAANSIFYRAERAEAAAYVQSQWGLPADYVLALGSADPRKNVTASARAYAALPEAVRHGRRLVVVLAHEALRPAMERLLTELGIAGEATTLVNQPRTAMQKIYAAAAVFVFPTLYEGFGMPPLEAMACGTPVITSNTTSIPEITGPAALLVDPQEVRALARALEAVLTEAGLAEALRHKGREQAARFSWERTARETLAVYSSAAAQ
ncbi:MAG: glycosyltransferase family 4 protein [Chloroflexi bacterium]|nr:glycosyltransferase family 4 protein [Chloroflexota bacterium]